MKISNYIEELAKDLTDKMEITCTINHLSSEYECICIRVMPSGNNRYYDETYRNVNLTFQILVKSKSQSKAIYLSEKIVDYLELKEIDVYTEPSLLSYDEQGYIYTSSFNTDLEIRRK